MPINNPPREPGFIIVGAMKAGTTTLAHALNAHEGISINQKELHFFNHLSKKTFAWYEGQLSAPPENITGEGTPTYSFLPHVPYQIAQHYPKTKILWVLRDPIQRTYSNYLHALKKGGSEKRTFEQAIEEELNSKTTDRFKCYAERSLYVEQIRRYLMHFSLEQMHFTVFEKFVDNPQEEINKVVDFLGVKRFERFNLPHSNKTKLPKQPRILRITLRLIPSEKGRKFVRYHLWPHTTSKPEMSYKTREKLVEYFNPYNRELETLINLPVTTLWQGADSFSFR